MQRKVIGIPMGDPAGIGPEIIVKALKDGQVYSGCKPLVAGNHRVFTRIMKHLNMPMSIHLIDDPAQGKYTPGTLDLIQAGDCDADSLHFGEIQAAAGRAAYDAIRKTCDLALAGSVAAIATTPINKEAIRAAGISCIGHTEMLADLTGCPDPLTMFQVHGMRVFFMSRHVSLMQACALVTRERVIHTILKCRKAMEQLRLGDKILAVAGLNPHNGEHGLFGDEEVREIEPAVREAREMGIACTGPVPADSVFHQALQGRYGAVLSLYHDQGHIATKTVDFEKTISITLGLPFIRTSVDHGTAFDIAGRGIASAVSMQEAIRLAGEYASYVSG
ncbi:MAG TPA: 4-hydroxythreonine-4-phosphate dehydrogenase PdxA [Clostridiales bacterium]|nr:4-hydroxythreonine-4-phosphate dehydrogenase PdxA [Clostridiales bacterium]